MIVYLIVLKQPLKSVIYLIVYQEFVLSVFDNWFWYSYYTMRSLFIVQK